MPVEMKEQTAMTALRDELRKVFEPFGARVEQFDVQIGKRLLRWVSRTPHYPSHHVGGAFEEWTNSGRYNKQHRIVITIVGDDSPLDPSHATEHLGLLEGRWVPERLSCAGISELLNTLGIPLSDPVLSVLPVKAIWNSH